MSDIKIAIPTHNRVEKIGPLLERLTPLGYEIFLFPNPKGEGEKYKKVAKRYGCTIVEIPNFNGMGGLRKNILDHFENGAKILMLDDDIMKIRKKIGNPNEFHSKTCNLAEVKEMIDMGFGMCEAMGYKLWGIEQKNLDSRFAVKYKSFIVGCLMGIIKSGITFDENIFSKEDYDFTLENIKTWGGVIKLGMYSVEQKYLKTEGGLQDFTRPHQRDIAYLKSKRGDIIQVKKNNPNEIKLKL